jgi:hypothetical protein
VRKKIRIATFSGMVTIILISLNSEFFTRTNLWNYEKHPRKRCQIETKSTALESPLPKTKFRKPTTNRLNEHSFGAVALMQFIFFLFLLLGH